MIEINSIQNLIFDLGDVLIHYRWHEMLRDYGLGPLEADRVGTEMFADPQRLWHQYDLGNLTTEEVIAAYRAEFPGDGAVIEWFIRHGEYMHVPRPRVWNLVHRLKEKGYGIYLLSNYPEELFCKHTEYADFMRDVDGMMISYQIHIGKPDRAIYAALCEKYRLEPGRCLFFDDRPENITAAREYGIRARQVLSHNSLLDDLRAIANDRPLQERDLKEKEKQLL